MVKILQTTLIAVLVVLSSTTSAYISPKQILRKGTKLVYDVNYSGTQYECTVTMNEESDSYNFDWKISSPENKSGSINVSKIALENANSLFSNFSGGKIQLKDECCFLLSRKMFNALKGNGSIEIFTDKKDGVLTIFGNPYNHTQTIGYQNNFSNEFECRTVSDGGDFQITYVNDENFPLIIEMNLGMKMKLKSIYN
ncbi:MAG: hypothetical protein IPM95_01005 [Sphingobacteriales bacterium]|nr:hypothetical protein [Sphingobacteriales bacterium]